MNKIEIPNSFLLEVPTPKTSLAFTPETILLSISLISSALAVCVGVASYSFKGAQLKASLEKMDDKIVGKVENIETKIVGKIENIENKISIVKDICEREYKNLAEEVKELKKSRNDIEMFLAKHSGFVPRNR